MSGPISSQRFATGDSVVVKRAFPPGHCRTPYYCRGKPGQIVRCCGHFRNPEELAYGKANEATRVALYRVRFPQGVLWPGYDGPAHDCVEIELYDHWLEPVSGDPR